MDTTSADCNGNSNYNDDSVARNNGQCVTTTPVKNGATKRTRQPDASKFNRSNRKSKNCAIFYFKHLDTDGENKDWSSQASEASEVLRLIKWGKKFSFSINRFVSSSYRPSNQQLHRKTNGYSRIVTIKLTMPMKKIEMTLALIRSYL